MTRNVALYIKDIRAKASREEGRSNCACWGLANGIVTQREITRSHRTAEIQD